LPPLFMEPSVRITRLTARLLIKSLGTIFIGLQSSRTSDVPILYQADSYIGVNTVNDLVLMVIHCGGVGHLVTIPPELSEGTDISMSSSTNSPSARKQLMWSRSTSNLQSSLSSLSSADLGS
jgi:hypothetical protein